MVCALTTSMVTNVYVMMSTPVFIVKQTSMNVARRLACMAFALMTSMGMHARVRVVTQASTVTWISTSARRRHASAVNVGMKSISTFANAIFTLQVNEQQMIPMMRNLVNFDVLGVFFFGKEIRSSISFSQEPSARRT